MRFLADENFNNDIIRGVWWRIPDASFTRVQDTDTYGADDLHVLAYAAERLTSHGYCGRSGGEAESLFLF